MVGVVVVGGVVVGVVVVGVVVLFLLGMFWCCLLCFLFIFCPTGWFNENYFL